MLKCPNNNCCTEFSDADIKANWRIFQECTCYVCGNQVNWDLDIEKYKPAPVKLAPVKLAPVKLAPVEAPAKKLPAKKKAASKKKTAAKNK